MPNVSDFGLYAGFRPAYRLAHPLEILDGPGFRSLVVTSEYQFAGHHTTNNNVETQGGGGGLMVVIDVAPRLSEKSP